MKTCAPVNIALIKYWGKASTDPVLPSTPSISLSLDAYASETTFEKSDTFSFELNGESLKGAALEKMRTFYERFNPTVPLQIKSFNSGPTAAGVASSASGFAAYACGLKEWFNPSMSLDEYVEITAYGSGSATRSLLGGAVMWHENGKVSNVPFNHTRYQMAIVLIDLTQKTISSRARMAESLNDHHFDDWVRRNRKRATQMVEAMAKDDFHAIGRLMESSTLDMHALIGLGKSQHAYLTPKSMQVWNAVIGARKVGLTMYVTADAGPNIKVLYETKDHAKVQTFLDGFNFPVTYSSITTQGAHVCM